MAGIDYTGLPKHMIDGATRYIETGILTGGFLTAVMENNLASAVINADSYNLRCIRIWALFLHNEAPRDCWGSREKVMAWSERGGLNGIPEGRKSEP